MRKELLIPTFLFLSVICKAQSGATKTINPYHVAYHDSLKKMDYPYRFPFLGKKAYKKGYDIQFPWGIGIAYFAQRQRVEISKTQISFNDGPPIDLTNIIEFGDIENTSYATSIRPNLWILPFLNIYGVFATGKSSTDVPLVKPINFKTTQNFSAVTAGAGATLAGGFGPFILIVDQNYNWVDVDAFVEPVPAYNLDIRVGHNFVNPRRADRSVTIWMGTFYQQIQNDTKGTIVVSDLLPGLSSTKKAEVTEDLTQWNTQLTPSQQAEVAPLIEHIQGYLAGNNSGDGEINYTLDKSLAGPWNLIFGAQYQHNKHWQMRCEVGTFGERTQFLLNLNYCWLGFKKK